MSDKSSSSSDNPAAHDFYQPGTGYWFSSKEAAEIACQAAAETANTKQESARQAFVDSLPWRGHCRCRDGDK